MNASGLGNLCVALARRPGRVISADDFVVVNEPVPQPGPGQLLVRTLALSLDPYMASAMRGRHMSGSIAPGEVMPGELVGTVQVSQHPAFAVGDTVVTRGGWRSWCLAQGDASPLGGMAGIIAPVAHMVAPTSALPATAWLGVLGMPGLTAYAVMERVLRPHPGDTVLVFAATGAVGSVAGQLARQMGARVVAFVGTTDKAARAFHLGYDDVVVRTAGDFTQQLQRACPNGIDVVLANDAGTSLTAVIGCLAQRARLALIGNMTQYNAAQNQPGPSLDRVISQRATLTGFVVFDHYDLMPEWQKLAAHQISLGQMQFQEDCTVGLAQAPHAFARLMLGETVGKTIVLAHDPAA